MVFEKYDGSNVGVAKIDDRIVALTRAGYEANTSPFRQHHLFDKRAKKHQKKFDEILDEGERIVGEWLIQAHGLIYTLKQEPIVFFDYFSSDNIRQPYDRLAKLDLPLPRL